MRTKQLHNVYVPLICQSISSLIKNTSIKLELGDLFVKGSFC